MVRLSNAKYTVTRLTSPATIHADEDGKIQNYPAGSYVMINQATGAVRVMSPTDYAANTEVVSGTVRPKSAAFTAVQATAPATVTTNDGKVQRAVAGDWLVTNTSTGEVQVYKPDVYAKMFE